MARTKGARLLERAFGRQRIEGIFGPDVDYVNPILDAESSCTASPTAQAAGAARRT